MALKIDNPMDRARTLQAIRLLRHLADTLERYGPQAYVDGGLMVQQDNETVPMAYDENQRAMGPSAYLGSTLSIQCDMVLRIPVHAPINGLKKILYGGEWYMWDGKPARLVLEGDVYNIAPSTYDDEGTLHTATRNLSAARFIYTLC